MKNNLCRFFLSLCVATLAVACCNNTSPAETSAPAKHFDSILNQCANLVTVFQNEIMG